MMESKRHNERRRYSRLPVSIEVDVQYPRGTITGCVARNVSPRGVFLTCDGDAQPPVGTEVTLLFRIWTGKENITRQIRAKVNRRTITTIALSFTDQDIVTFGVVQDILYYRQFERRARPRRRAEEGKATPVYRDWDSNVLH